MSFTERTKSSIMFHENYHVPVPSCNSRFKMFYFLVRASQLSNNKNLKVKLLNFYTLTTFCMIFTIIDKYQEVSCNCKIQTNLFRECNMDIWYSIFLNTQKYCTYLFCDSEEKYAVLYYYNFCTIQCVWNNPKSTKNHYKSYAWQKYLQLYMP